MVDECPWAVRCGAGGEWGRGIGLIELSDFLNYVHGGVKMHVWFLKYCLWCEGMDVSRGKHSCPISLTNVPETPPPAVHLSPADPGT